MKMNKKLRRILLTVCSAALLVCVTVGATVAYLTSSDTVTNTFTVGNVQIKLDEAKAKADGSLVENANRVQANSYKLLPGHTYTKDPTVHVTAGSEDCWLFVKVENGISAFEAEKVQATDQDGKPSVDEQNNPVYAYLPIADQILANGWTALDGVAGVYYKQYSSQKSAKDEVVFENFKIADGAQDVSGWSSIDANTTKVTINAYAVQKDGFDTADAAWTATFGKPEGE